MILINSYESDNFQKMIFKFLFLEFELKVLKGIEQMRLQMQHNTTMLQLLLKKVDLPAFQDDDEDQSCLPNMPITSLEQFDEVNEAIKMISETAWWVLKMFDKNFIKQKNDLKNFHKKNYLVIIPENCSWTMNWGLIVC